MKKILIVLLFLFLCGCSSTYELRISNNSFKESIDIIIPNSTIDDEHEQVVDPATGVLIERDNPLDSILDSTPSALFSKISKYKKSIKKYEDVTNVNLKYKYNEKNFGDSNVLNTCFENSEFKNDKNYSINATGTFYCLHTDSMDIKITTSNKVISHNANEVINNTYIWHINASNRNNVDIKFVASKGTSYVFLYGIALLIVIILIGYGLYKLFIKRNIQNNSI